MTWSGVKAGDILEVTVPREDLQQRLPWGEEYSRYGPQKAQIMEMAKRGDAKALLATFLKVFDDHGMQAQVKTTRRAKSQPRPHIKNPKPKTQNPNPES